MYRIASSSGIKLGICGKGRAGKDTAAEFLAVTTGLRYTAGTSFWAKDLVFAWFQINEPGRYRDTQHCWEDRHNNRQLWADIIGDYNRDDPVKLYKDCLENQNFLTGVRWKHEMRAIKQAAIVDCWLWVENPRVPKDVSCQVTMDDCDLVVLNNSDLNTYLERLSGIACLLARK